MKNCEHLVEIVQYTVPFLYMDGAAGSNCSLISLGRVYSGMFYTNCSFITPGGMM